MAFSAKEYYELANTNILAVSEALGYEVDTSKLSTPKAIHLLHSGGTYIFMDNNNWYRHSDGAKGFPIDLVMDNLNCTKEHALEFIKSNISTATSRCRPQPPKKEKSKAGFRLPVQITPKRARAYLIKTRGIDAEIVDALINTGDIAEDAQYHNCLFIGRDSSGTARSCAVRGTGTKQFRKEQAGSDKSYSFAIKGCDHRLRLFESPVDALSHATFSKLLGFDWRLDHRLSTDGCGYEAVRRYITEHEEITNVIISFDTDAPGRRGAENHRKKIISEFAERDISIYFVYPQRKDWNEDLIAFRAREKKGVNAFEFLASAYPQLTTI